jgi:TonB family protein
VKVGTSAKVSREMTDSTWHRSVFLMAMILLSLASLWNQTAQSQAQLAPPFSLTLDVPMHVEEADLRPFLQDMYKRIKQVAVETLPKSLSHGEQGVVTLQLEVQKKGSLGRSVTMLESSGKKDLEKHAVTAIRASAPFKELPNSSPVPLELRLTFYYNTAPPTS